MGTTEQNGTDRFLLTEEHRMLLRMRDTLYEGGWEDFARDLRARVQGRPHVFETIPDSPSMQATIKDHLGMIGDMQAWETRHGHPLSPEDGADAPV